MLQMGLRMVGGVLAHHAKPDSKTCGLSGHAWPTKIA
jgi:hypothetical protein